MSKALVILHTAPDQPDYRALTALRLSGAMLAEGKEVCVFLVEGGVRLADPQLDATNPCRALFYELLDVGLDVQVCGGTLKKLGWDHGYLLPGITPSSMKGLSSLMSAADEIVSF